MRKPRFVADVAYSPQHSLSTQFHLMLPPHRAFRQSTSTNIVSHIPVKDPSRMLPTIGFHDAHINQAFCHSDSHRRGPLLSNLASWAG